MTYFHFLTVDIPWTFTTRYNEQESDCLHAAITTADAAALPPSLCRPPWTTWTTSRTHPLSLCAMQREAESTQRASGHCNA